MSNTNDKDNMSEKLDPNNLPNVDFHGYQEDDQEVHHESTIPPNPFDVTQKEEDMISRSLDNSALRNRKKKRDNNKIAVIQTAMYKIQEEKKDTDSNYTPIGDKQYINDSIKENFNEEQQELLNNSLDNNYNNFTNSIEENIYDLLQDKANVSQNVKNYNEDNIEEESDVYYELLSNMNQDDYQDLLNKATLSTMHEFVNEYDTNEHVDNLENDEQHHENNDKEKKNVENQNYTEGSVNSEEDNNLPKINFGINRKDESISDRYLGSPDYTDQVDWVDQNTKNTLSDALKYSDEINEDQFDNALEFARDKRDEEDERKKRSKKLPPIVFPGKNINKNENNIEENNPLIHNEDDIETKEISSDNLVDLNNEDDHDEEENKNENNFSDRESNNVIQGTEGTEGTEGEEEKKEHDIKDKYDIKRSDNSQKKDSEERKGQKLPDKGKKINQETKRDPKGEKNDVEKPKDRKNTNLSLGEKKNKNDVEKKGKPASNPFSGNVAGINSKQNSKKSSTSNNKENTKSHKKVSPFNEAGKVGANPKTHRMDSTKFNPAIKRQSRNKMEKSPTLSKLRKPPVTKVATTVAGGASKGLLSKILVPLLILILVIPFLRSCLNFSTDSLYVDRSQEDAMKYITTEQCTLDDSGSGESEGGFGGKGARGVPNGEYAKPVIMGEIGTKEDNKSDAIIVRGLEVSGHYGLDISSNKNLTHTDSNGKPRSTDVLFNTQDGIVQMVNCTTDPDGYGCYIVISHDDDTGSYYTLHGHMYPDEIFVKEGDEVEAGQIISYMGSNGGSSGLHDHFEIREAPSKLEAGAGIGNYFGTTPEDGRDYVAGGINPDPEKSKGTLKGITIGPAGGKSEIQADGTRSKSEDSDDSDSKDKKKNSSKKKDLDSDDESSKDKKTTITKGDTKTLIETVKSPVGKKEYQMGGVGPDKFDCSGLMYWAYQKIGIEIPRTTFDQKEAGEIIWDVDKDGGSIPEDKLKPGDLIFYYEDFHHVAMYVGDGMVVNAATDGVPLKDQIQHEPIAQGGGKVMRAVRIDPDIANGAKESTSGSGSEDGQTNASYENCLCGSGETEKSAYEKTNGQSASSIVPEDYKNNGDFIIDYGRSLGLDDNQIALALAISDANTGMANVANRNNVGNEQIPAEELARSLEHDPEGDTDDPAGRMGLFFLIPGKDGKVSELMDKKYSTEYVFEKIQNIDGLNENNWDEKLKEIDFTFPHNPSKSKQIANDMVKERNDTDNKDNKDNENNENNENNESQEKKNENISSQKKTNTKYNIKAHGTGGRIKTYDEDAVWLKEALEEFGVKTKETDGWKTRSQGRFNGLKGIVAHHTGSSSSDPDKEANFVKFNPRIAGTLSAQIYLAKDGTAYLLGSGVANHAGLGSFKNWNTNNANVQSIGIEAAGDGKEKWPAEQLDAYYRLSAAILTYIGNDATPDTLIGHWEYSQKAQGKWDPGKGVPGKEETMDMDRFRDNVQKYIDAYKKKKLNSANIDWNFEGVDGKPSNYTGGHDDYSYECATDDTSSSSKSSGKFNSEEIPEEYVKLIEDAASKTDNIDPATLAAILYIESGFNPKASSGVAHGIAQFTPSTWATWGEGGDIWDPKDAIPASARFLDELYKHSEKVLQDNGGKGDDVLELMAASYNGGPGAIMEQACGTPARVPNCGDPNTMSSYRAQTYPYAKEKFPQAREKFLK